MSESNLNQRVIPVFPLSLVQFPGAVTPLHIFEPRYRKLLSDVMDADKTFGIIYHGERDEDEEDAAPLLERPLLGGAGCLVEVAVVQELKEGRSNIICVGTQRYRLLDYVEGEPYLRAEVEIFDDETFFDDLSAEVKQVKKLFERVLIAGRKLREESNEVETDLPDLPEDPQMLSFITAAYLDIEADEKQEMLEMVDTGQRLRRVHSLLSTLVGDYERRAVVQILSKKNGHAGPPPNLDQF